MLLTVRFPDGLGRCWLYLCVGEVAWKMAKRVFAMLSRGLGLRLPAPYAWPRVGGLSHIVRSSMLILLCSDLGHDT